jgi:hypothetical protein
MKYVSALTLMLAFVLMVPTAHAESGSSDTSSASDSTVISCLKTAVSTREASIASGWDTFSAAIDSAYSARKSALDSAYSNDTRAEVKNAVKTAWKDFKDDVKEARSAWKKTRGDAWKTFKSAKKACRASKDVDDSSNESTEAGA